MIGFHIDMNVAQFTREYLEKWLRDLAARGYDTILWEVEDNIAWDSCPECVSPEAFSKREFGEILALSRDLGLEPIPLLQTIAHSEYVLKHEPYGHLAEVPGKHGQYCPLNSDVVEFLARWTDEYLEVFGDVKYFHLGADEAGALGRCEKCSEFAEAHSISELFVRHMNTVSAPLLKRGVKPMIWADMLLRHPEALGLLSREIGLFDWRYNVYHGCGWVPIRVLKSARHKEIPADVLETYGDRLYPLGREAGREPNPFYTAGYLADQGFEVVTCPASSCFNDSVFTPSNWLRVVNTFDSLREGAAPGLSGSVITSWTVRLVPWELQVAALDIPAFIREHPDASVDAYQHFFTESRFGVDEDDFWRNCARLSNRCLFMDSRSLGFYKGCRPTPEGHIDSVLDKVCEEGRLEGELANARERLDDYRAAAAYFVSFRERAPKGRDLVDLWALAALNMVNRAEACVFLLAHRMAEGGEGEAPPPEEGRGILERMGELRKETEAFYARSIKPKRRALILSWIYDAVGKAIRDRVAGS
jgi:hypothetical protein